MSWASLLHFPPLPDVPAFARGRSFAVVMAAFLGDEAEGASLLRAAARPRPGARHVRDGAAGRARRPGDGPARPAAVPQHLTRCSTSCRRRRSTRCWPTAGPESGPRPDGDDAAAPPHGRRAGARDAGRRRARDAARARSACSRSASVFDEAMRRGRARGARRHRRAPCCRTAPATTRTSSRSRPTRAPSSTPATWARLRAVKAAYDPADLFVGNHHIPPA